METALQKAEPESASAIQLAQPDVPKILYEVARKLEHATGIDQNELGKMKLVAFETFLRIEEILGIESNANKKTVFPINEMYLLAHKISIFQSEIDANREKIAPLLRTLTEMSGKLPG
jgi:hypothetical protein